MIKIENKMHLLFEKVRNKKLRYFSRLSLFLASLNSIPSALSSSYLQIAYSDHSIDTLLYQLNEEPLAVMKYAPLMGINVLPASI
jgi:hypothetical protein